MRNTDDLYSHAAPEPLPTSPRGHEVALHFRLRWSEGETAARAPTCATPLPTPGQILFIGGASGSGKSSLLRTLQRKARGSYERLNLARVPLPPKPVVDLFDDPAFPITLRRLCAVGLAEVWTWLRRPSELSEGQRWRLRLALALQWSETRDRPMLLVCDEFAAVLDRVSACIVARVVRQAVDRHPARLAALIATSHDDLLRALRPDIRIDCDFGQHRIIRRKRGGR